MKSLTTLLLAMLLCIVYATEVKDGKCKLNGGRCISKIAMQDRCVRLPYRCGPTAVCCKTNRRIQENRITKAKKSKEPGKRNVRRKCRQTRKKCSKHNGVCIAAKSNDCGTITDDKLCKGASCTCCLGDKESCNSLPGCKFRGGFCIKKKKSSYCEGGTVDDALCKRRKCTCCLIEKDCKCGQANEARIVGGEEVSPQNKYPWMVGISTRGDETGYFCGAALINDRYVITAAHCLFDYYTGEAVEAEDIQVRLADHNNNSMEDDIPDVTRLVDIEKYIVHKNYDVNRYDEDIALIKLKVPLDLSANKEIQPVCLPINEEKTYEGADGIAAGWGLQDHFDLSASEVLMEVTIPILSPECGGKSYDIKITDNMLCAGLEEGGKGICFGDSGGPLVVKEGVIHTLVGITSLVTGLCAEPNFPSVFTRVTRYLDWIIEITSDGSYCS